MFYSSYFSIFKSKSEAFKIKRASLNCLRTEQLQDRKFQKIFKRFLKTLKIPYNFLKIDFVLFFGPSWNFWGRSFRFASKF